MEKVLESVHLQQPRDRRDSTPVSRRHSESPSQSPEEVSDYYASLHTGPKTESHVVGMCSSLIDKIPPLTTKGPTTPASIFSPKGIMTVNRLTGDQSFARIADDLLHGDAEPHHARSADGLPQLPSQGHMVSCVECGCISFMQMRRC